MHRALPLLLLAAVPLPAQYALSAMAGYIHYTEGEVWLGDRAIAPRPSDFEHVLEGRRLRTGQGRAEILLVPGSFVRVGEASEIEMIASGLTSARLRLVSGAIVVDLQTQFEKDAIAIVVGDHEVRFRKTGLYRIDAGESVSPRLRVLDGRAHITDQGEGFDLKSRQQAELGSGIAEKMVNDLSDALDQWNAERHDKLEVLAQEVRKGRGDNMDQAERDLLRMLLSRPGAPPVSNRPQSPAPAARPSK